MDSLSLTLSVMQASLCYALTYTVCSAGRVTSATMLYLQCSEGHEYHFDLSAVQGG